MTEIILNNQKKMNHLTLNMLQIMLIKLKEWERGDKPMPKAIIVSGAGGKSFCSGGDMRGLYDAYTGAMPKSY